MTGRARRQYPEDAKTKLGLSTMPWVSTGGSAFMTSLFMLYLTDYANIGAFAAILGTSLLLFGRIFDAVNDPLQGWIMDRAKPGKLGKYRPFIMLSIVLTVVAILMLYGLPPAIAQNPVLVSIWVIFFYLLYDFGSSFYAQTPLMISLSSDPDVRARLTVWPRVIGMFVAIPFAFFISMVAGLNNVIGDMSKSFSLMTLFIMLPVGVISMIGILLVKEGKHAVPEDAQGKFNLKEIFYMFKTNKPWAISQLSAVFGGFIWTLVLATTTYYVKWTYCADLTTGTIDAAKLGLYITIMGMMQMLPVMLAAMISPRLMKLFKNAVRLFQFAQYVIAGIGIIMFLLNLAGILAASPTAFFILLALMEFAIGLCFVPGTVIGMETMDYGHYKTGREMHGIINAAGNFIMKAQGALSSAMVGAILIAIGYQVDSATDTYLGELSSIPVMTDWFIVVSGLLPAVFAIISNIILYFYPINDQIRTEMREELDRRKQEAAALEI